MVYKNLIFFTLVVTLNIPNISIANSYTLGKESVEYLKANDFKCPTLNSEMLDVLKKGGLIALNKLSLKTNMALDEFKKQIPGSLYFISQKKLFDASKTLFTVSSDGQIKINCEYEWQSAVAGLTKTLHSFTIFSPVPLKSTKINITNQTTQELKIDIVSELNKAHHLFGDEILKIKDIIIQRGDNTIQAGQSKAVDFMQTELDPVTERALNIKNVIVQGYLPTESKSRYSCMPAPIGSTSKFVFTKDGATIKCIAQ